MRSQLARQMEKSLSALAGKNQNIAVKLEANWGSTEANLCFKKLLVKDRDNREGLDFRTYIAVFELYIIHLSEYGDFNCPIRMSNINFDLSTVEHNEWDSNMSRYF